MTRSPEPRGRDHSCHLPAGRTASALCTVDVTPRTAGWDFSSLRAHGS
jgi:hypothetical protein